MVNGVKPVERSRGGRGWWPTEVKLAALQEWRSGLPVEEVCRKFGMSAALLYRWKRTVEQGLKESGELVPRSRVAALCPEVLEGLHQRIDELERALGRKAFEVEVLRKAFERKGLKLPEGMSGG